MRHHCGRSEGNALDTRSRHYCNRIGREGFEARRAMMVMPGMGGLVGFGRGTSIGTISVMMISINHFERVCVDLAGTMGNRRRTNAAK